MLAGYYNANAGLYRFAATELVAPDVQGARDLVGARRRHHRRGRRAEPGAPDAQRCCRSSSPAPTRRSPLVALCSLATISCIRFPPLPLPSAAAPGRPLREIVAQPVFIVAVVACALGYGVMNLLMAATPIAMAMCSHPFADTALVLEWHVLGMFVPSFFTGNLIRRFGALPVMAVGVVLNGVCIAVALSGVELEHFLVALFTLGVGWNFLFIGGTSLVTTAYRPEEKTTRAGGDGHDHLHDHDDHLVQLGRAGHDAGLDLAQPRLDRAGALIRRRRWPGSRRSAAPRCGAPAAGPGRAARRAGDHVEAEQAALDRPVPHRHAARFLQPHRARQLHVGAEHPGRPAGVRV